MIKKNYPDKKKGWNIFFVSLREKLKLYIKDGVFLDLKKVPAS